MIFDKRIAGAVSSEIAKGRMGGIEMRVFERRGRGIINERLRR